MSDNLYKESNFSKFTAGIFVLVIGGLLFTFIYQLLVGPLGTNPASNEFYVIMILIFLAVTINFRVKGKWRIVYNIVEGDRVVLIINRGWYREFVFSTREPQKVMNIINNRK